MILAVTIGEMQRLNIASRLTAASVKQARQWKLNGDSYSTIAARLGVGVTTVYKAIKGITWATI